MRTTGSGMGCPDWPKCFGQYIPPTDLSQLPADYKTRFAVQGKEIADFDAFKTWIEYINRLLGALLGVFVLVQLVAAFRSRDSLTTTLCFAELVMTGFVGWLGSVVVATDLQPVKVTIHMLTAFIIVALSVGIAYRVVLRTRQEREAERLNYQQHRVYVPRTIVFVLVAALTLTIAQVVMGTQVREHVDELAKTGMARELWIDHLPSVFKVHRSFSILVLLLNSYVVYVALTALRYDKTFYRSSLVLAALVGAEIVTGITLAYLAVPKAAQPIHLVLASGVFAVQFYMLIALRVSPELPPTQELFTEAFLAQTQAANVAMNRNGNARTADKRGGKDEPVNQ